MASKLDPERAIWLECQKLEATKVPYIKVTDLTLRMAKHISLDTSQIRKVITTHSSPWYSIACLEEDYCLLQSTQSLLDQPKNPHHLEILTRREIDESTLTQYHIDLRDQIRELAECFRYYATLKTARRENLQLLIGLHRVNKELRLDEEDLERDYIAAQFIELLKTQVDGPVTPEYAIKQWESLCVNAPAGWNQVVPQMVAKLWGQTESLLSKSKPQHRDLADLDRIIPKHSWEEFSALWMYLIPYIGLYARTYQEDPVRLKDGYLVLSQWLNPEEREILKLHNFIDSIN